MLHRLLHPDIRVLSDFVDGELPQERARRVARHVASCRRCRDFVWSCRRIDAAAQELAATELAVPPLPAALRERVLARRAAGEDVILPVAAPSSSRSAPVARLAATAAALVMLLGIGMFVVGTPSLTAEASELRLTPAEPKVGDTIRVEYRATSRLSGHDVLRLRARHRRADSFMDATAYTVLTRLERRRDGVYTGAFVLPDGVLYAVLAVEDTAAREVDHNGERWDVLLHGDDGIPLHDALNDQLRDVRMRDRIAAVEVADRMVRHYPASVRARLNQLLRHVDFADRDEDEAIRAAHRAALPDLLAAQTTTPAATTLSDIVFYSDYARDTATTRIYRGRLIADYPLHPAAQQQRVFALGRSWAGDTAAYWNGLERLWQETEDVTRHGQIAMTGWQTAQQWNDHAALRIWGHRLAEEDGSGAWVGQSMAGIPELRADGIALLQDAVASMHERDEEMRGLTHTAAEFAALRNRVRGGLLASLGAALIATGDEAGGDAVLAEAIELAWEPQLFRSVAETRLRSGDTIAALQLLARVAVDPATPAAFADSVRARAGAEYDDAEWHASWTALQADARVVMQRHTMHLATNRPVQGRPRLQNAAGARQVFEPAAGEVTLVAFWNRYCPPSLMQLGQLAQLGRTLEQRGVRVVTITEERPSAALSAFIERSNLDLDVLYDVDREARRAFDNFATPAYLVVDGQGRIRFQGHGLDDVLRQVHLLQRAAVQ